MLRVQNTHSRRAMRGFTLVELMVTLAVLAILLGIAVPSFTRTMASNRMSTQTNEFLAGFKLARSEAIRRGQSVSIRADANESPANFASSGWTIFTDSDSDGVPASTPTEADGTTIRVSGALAGNTTIHRVGEAPGYAAYTATDKRYVVFNSRGGNAANAAAFFRICNAGNPGAQGRIVRVSVVGNVTLDSTTATCP